MWWTVIFLFFLLFHKIKLKRLQWRNPVARLQKNMFVSCSGNISPAHIFIALILYFRLRLQRAKRIATGATYRFWKNIPGRGLVHFCRPAAGCRSPEEDSLRSEWKQKRDVKVNFTKSGVPTSKAGAAGVLRNRNVSLRPTVPANSVFLWLGNASLTCNDVLILN